MNFENKLIISAAIILVGILIIGGYSFLNSALARLEQKQETSSFSPMQNVEIKAATFNGDIEIQTTDNRLIEITYMLEAPEGHINQLIVDTTNQTQGESALIIAEAKIKDSTEIKVNYKASIVIKLPNNSQYNLTLNTLNGNIIKPLLNDITVVATTNNGRIEIKDNNATSIAASSLNGNINIDLLEGTLFKIDASTANGQVSYQGIAINSNIQTSTHLNGITTYGSGTLDLKLSTANGNIFVEYFSE